MARMILLLWTLKMEDLLVQQGCNATLEGEAKLPKDTTKILKKHILEKVHNTIMLSLKDEELLEVANQMSTDVIWEKICDKFQKNYLTNRLY